MEFTNLELEKEIDDFFRESIRSIDAILNELGLDVKQVCADECDEFQLKRDELLKNFEHHLFKNCSILKELEDENNLPEILNEKINKMIKEEQSINSDLAELASKKENLRGMLDVKSNLIKESIEKKKEIERICNESVKEEFVRLCKFMNLKFQWNQIEKKFTIGNILTFHLSLSAK